jgi:quercetin dioxygenase-like cupin family protein
VSIAKGKFKAGGSLGHKWYSQNSVNGSNQQSTVDYSDAMRSISRIPLASTIVCALVLAAAANSGSRVRSVFTSPLPEMDGTHLKATLVEVNYGPGESSTPHTHPCPVIVYVLEGSLRTQVTGQPETIYQAGQSFYEAPNGVHLVSANASKTVRARFMAYFVCDRDTPLSNNLPQPSGAKQ